MAVGFLLIKTVLFHDGLAEGLSYQDAVQFGWLLLNASCCA